MKELIITTVFSLVTGIAGWFAGRRKSMAQTRTIEIENVERAVKIWQELAENYAKKLMDVQNDIDRVSADNRLLRAEVDELRKKVATLTCNNKKLNKKIEVLTKTENDNETV